MLPSSLTASVVTHRPDLGLLERCLCTLGTAIALAQREGVVRSVAVALIDNSEDPPTAAAVAELGNRCLGAAGVRLTCLRGHTNIGYGAAHNLMLNGTAADYQLVLNPDVELAADALANAIRWLDEHREIGVVAPAVRRPDGKPDYVCKRYPAVLDLVVRGFLPRWAHWPWRRRLARYEMRDLIDAHSAAPVLDIPLLSGCCMLVRRQAIDTTGGFDPSFFLYFEDYDWSLRLSEVTRTAYLPAMRVIHHGGAAARKGWRHVFMFTRSGIRFFNKHGWRWW